MTVLVYKKNLIKNNNNWIFMLDNIWSSHIFKYLHYNVKIFKIFILNFDILVFYLNLFLNFSKTNNIISF